VLRLGIVDDHPVARRGIAAVMAEDENMVVVSSGATPADLTAPAELDVVLCDLYLGEGRLAVAEVRELAAVTRVLMVSAASRPADVLACIAAGAAGYVTKESDELALRDAVRQVAKGGFYISPQLAGIVGAASRSATTAACGPLLSPREEETLNWIARGFTHAQTARRMNVTTSTVDTYVKRIRARLHLGNKAELAWFAHNLANATSDRGAGIGTTGPTDRPAGADGSGEADARA
jgi:DNA-binding NarL/FixJ family response regulator